MSNVTASAARGTCECGCGAATRIAQRNDTRRGWTKGHPIRYVHGHNRRKGTRWTECSTGYGTPCWIWLLSKNAAGYGVTTVSGVCTTAHRAVYQTLVGPVAPPLQLDHLCRVRSCVNPDHLEPVTAAINVRRGAVTKLSPGEVADIRATTATQRALAVVPE
jgi:hypothetical protein